MSPLANAFLGESQICAMERFYPLRVFVCGGCFLVQLEEFESPSDIFSDYAYFSSFSTSWLDHCKRYVDRITPELGLDKRHRVVEIASNDGYLLQYFQQHGVPVLGIEPAANVARVAVAKGIPTEVAFFGRETATSLRSRGIRADLVIGNNVLAHVPDINDFVAGVRTLLCDDGVATFEFPHLLELMKHVQFDTIYHEHFSYLSALTVSRIFDSHDLSVIRVERLPTHGGSLRVWLTPHGSSRPRDGSVDEVLEAERRAGLDSLRTYGFFTEAVEQVKRRLLTFLIEARDDGKNVAAYGAAAKGTTLLNYCGVRTDFVDYVVDRNPHKQGKYLPGCHIPIFDPQRINETKPDYLLILPWNLRDEIAEQMAHLRDWGGRFVVPIPELEIF